MSHSLDAGKQEYKTPAFATLNPHGKVPVVNADGVIIHESIAIMAFLERAYPSPALFGETAAETVRIW